MSSVFASAKNAPSNSQMSRRNGNDFIERIVPASRCLFMSRDGTSSKGNIRRQYFSSFMIHHDSEMYQWKVHIGDIVAVSMADLSGSEDGSLSLEDIEDWQPNHLQKASPHWKVGLVLALMKVVGNGKISHECHVEWLEKALDTRFAKDKKLRENFRPWTKNEPRSKFPHLLLRSFCYASIDPANLLPAQITMLTDAQFKDGWAWDPDNRFQFHMHCPKKIEPSKDGSPPTYQPDGCMDDWPELNHMIFFHRRKKTNNSAQPLPIPKPLKHAWTKSTLVQENDGLLQALMQGFRDSADSKAQEFMNFKNRHFKQQKLAQEEEERLRIEAEAKKEATRAAAKRTANKNDSDANSSKRVRIHEPGNTPKTTVTQPVPAKAAVKQDVKSIFKKAGKTAKHKIQSLRTPKSKSNESSTISQRINTTPSTISNSTASSSPGNRMANLCLSKKQLAMKVEAPTETIVHRGKQAGQVCHFYERIKVSMKQKSRHRVVMIGDVVPVVAQDDIAGDATKRQPFGLPWGVVQILAIYQAKDSGEWLMQIRHLLRFHQLLDPLKNQLKRRKSGIDQEQGLLETAEVEVLPIRAILPAKITISNTKPKERLPEHVPQSFVDESELPLLEFQCKHFRDEHGSLATKADWKDFVADSSRIKGPFTRAFNSMQMHPRLIEKYKSEVKTRICDSDDRSLEETEESVSTLQISAVASKPIFEGWGVKFHDCVRMDIDTNTLDTSFRPETKQRTIRVGYIVPLACEFDNDNAQLGREDDKRWFPFLCSWGPAQIVSIYENEAGRWKMQIRWFHRYQELLQQQQTSVETLDKPHVVFETEEYDHVDVASCLPGRVILSSSICDNWDIVKSKLSGLPLIPRFCSHICVDEEIDELPDWTNYDVRLPLCPKPLTRGLLLEPRNRTRKEWILMLSRYYTKHVRLRAPDPEEDALRQWAGNGRPALSLVTAGAVAFDQSKVGAQITKVMELGDRTKELPRRFAESVKVSIPSEYIALPSKAIRRARQHVFVVKVGDIVAYNAEDARPKSDHVLMKHLRHPFFPYQVPWSFGQVLAVYSDESSPTSPAVEIRRFYRYSDIPQELQAFVPVSDDAEREQVFESNEVVKPIALSRILGLVKIFLGRHDRAPKGSDERETMTSCRCKYFYDANHQRFLPIFSGSFSPESWWDRLVTRAIELSRTMKSSSDMKDATMACAKKSNTIDVRTVLGDISMTVSTGEGVVSTADRTYFTKATMSPQWAEFEDHDLHFHKDDRKHITWEVKLGDFLVSKAVPDTAGSITFPFRCPSIPCQLMAIFSDGRTSPEALFFEVCYFETEEGPGTQPSEVSQVQKQECAILRYSDLLGPATIVARGGIGTHLERGTVSHVLPSAIFYGAKSRLIETNDLLPRSSVYTAEALEATLKHMRSTTQPLEQGAVNAPDHHVVGGNNGGARTLGYPIHVDVSKLQAFYSGISLAIQKKMFINGSVGTGSDRSSWDVQVGEVVLIHCDGAKRYPLNCNWGVAEIVAIWKEFDSRDELEKEAHATNGDDQDLRIEIRWFYERNDLTRISSAEAEMDSNEILETDDVYILSDPTTLLGPVKVYSNLDSGHSDNMFANTSIPDFVCRRFWSTTRKSLIPCGGLDGRERRGRLYSQCIPKHLPTSKTPMSALLVDSNQKGASSRMSWVESVKAIIAKLNLKDASKGASARGETLVGREKELTQLLSFFRSAIRGVPGPGGIRSSMLIAGPPGVGKTQSIHSAVTQLHTEQARGDIPAFKFIPLNGMEMRHPFEAYVKLWEAVSGGKHVGSHEKACQQLEYHFTNPKALSSDRESSVTVVLLDEIDYLVTEKQSVLYNFFDWPKRAASIAEGRRLVVIGVSNTLNLAEQLMPSVQSRLGTERIAFKAYSVNDAEAILNAKIDEVSPEFSIFENDAIRFAARKTAAMSGDIRKAFQICRGAADLVLRRNDENKENCQGNAKTQPTVRVSDVQKASRQSFDSALVTAVSFSSPFQALLLVSLASLCRTTGREVGGFDITDIMTKMESLVGSVGDSQYSPPPAFGETLQLLNRLAETNLITLRTSSSSSTSFRSCAGGSGGAWPMTALAVDEHTIVRGLKNTCHKALAEKSLPSLY